MKILIKNLGPIHEFEFDLDKDLHLVYGKNSIGKSHAIAAVYLIFKNILKAKQHPEFLHSTDEDVEKLSEFTNKEFEGSLLLNPLAEEILIEELSFFLQLLVNSFHNSFSNLENLKNRRNIEQSTISMDFKNLFIQLKFSENRIWQVEKLQIKKNFSLQLATYNNTKIDKFGNHIYKSEKKKPGLSFFRDVRDCLALSFNEVSDKISDIYFLPASRSGLYVGMSATAPLLTEFSQLRYSLPNMTFNIPTFSEPMSDYFLQLTSIKVNGKVDVFNQIAHKMEQGILKGAVVFNGDKKRLEYQEHGLNVNLLVTETSSMISEIAPIVAFLKYILKQEKEIELRHSKKVTSIFSETAQNILFIEEPEAHLHPSVQVEMMRLFIELANNGVKIVMTTHSDFMFNELTNLILADKIKPKQVASIHLVMTEKGSVDKGDMQATADGIDDFNFSEVTEQLYEERMRLIDLKNETADAIQEN